MSTTVPVLAVTSLTLSADRRPLVEGLSFTVRPGERWCILGRNAAGKSTLLRALAGLPVPSQSGKIVLQGDAGMARDAARAAHARAYLPQQANDRFDLRVREWLQLHAGSQMALETPALEALDVAHLLDRTITRLSGGERQRVGLAAVALRHVPLYLLDEPVSFQDPAHQRKVAHWLRAQSGVAMVMSAHDLSWVQHAATHVIALMDNGQWRAGALADVLTEDTLTWTYGCRWTCVQGVWLPRD